MTDKRSLKRVIGFFFVIHFLYKMWQHTCNSHTVEPTLLRRQLSGLWHIHKVLQPSPLVSEAPHLRWALILLSLVHGTCGLLQVVTNSIISDFCFCDPILSWPPSVNAMDWAQKLQDGSSRAIVLHHTKTWEMAWVGLINEPVDHGLCEEEQWLPQRPRTAFFFF